jgi:hypothetical protein
VTAFYTILSSIIKTLIIYFISYHIISTMPLKLGSNWKSCGIGTEMRRWDHGNERVIT